MTGIPLVNTNSVNDINTSIIAIKKEMKNTGETEVNVNVNLPDTAIPVDEVTSGNMHSVTSNAVANAMSYSTSEVNTGKKWIDGKPIYKIAFYSETNWSNNTKIGELNNVSAIISISDITCDGSGSRYQNYGTDGTNTSYTIVRSNNQVYVNRAGTFINSYPSIVIIEYTKTTD